MSHMLRPQHSMKNHSLAQLSNHVHKPLSTFISFQLYYSRYSFLMYSANAHKLPVASQSHQDLYSVTVTMHLKWVSSAN
ncbi:hypothetical protein GDO78_013183 [Eleutherodactylus coqui]|uniref:Uncharacterized protein n=1 Tax=Eleutherodactylus coqui TaxID=57060 RepID=A0A8J6K792_ELECQ|nr:hypothetical protein GDO78_013183 [Eleutherodactylus coqui]